MIDCQKIKDISENLMRRFGQERCEAGKCRGEEDCVVKRILEKMRREPIGYMVYLAALFAILFVGISDLNPGHIYIGPSGRERYNCSGGNMGGLNIEVDETPLLILACVIVVLAVSRPENGIRFSTAQKIFFLCLCAVIISMTWGSMYLLYNEVGNNLITGFQGRYLFPVMLLLLAGLENRNFVRKTGALNRWLYPLAGSINLYVLLLVAEEMSW